MATLCFSAPGISDSVLREWACRIASALGKPVAFACNDWHGFGMVYTPPLPIRFVSPFAVAASSLENEPVDVQIVKMSSLPRPVHLVDLIIQLSSAHPSQDSDHARALPPESR